MCPGSDKDRAGLKMEEANEFARLQAKEAKANGSSIRLVVKKVKLGFDTDKRTCTTSTRCHVLRPNV